jgi:mannose-6-phosphate isomerase
MSRDTIVAEIERMNPLTREDRPWGSWTVLEEGPAYKIKRLEVAPGKRMSLQMHYHRSEHWVVVSGTARVVIGDRTGLVHRQESTFVPAGTVHRIENPGLIPLVIIEIQNGQYLEEDDIVRLQDDHGRVPADTAVPRHPAGNFE